MTLHPAIFLFHLDKEDPVVLVNVSVFRMSIYFEILSSCDLQILKIYTDTKKWFSRFNEQQQPMYHKLLIL